MTEAEWLSSVDPLALLDHYAPFASRRKLRLAAVACARQAWTCLADRWSREAIEAAERHADRTIDHHDFAVARSSAAEAVCWAEQQAPGAALHAARAARAATEEQADKAVRSVAIHIGQIGGDCTGPILCHLVRDILGNPFRPVTLEPSWLGRDAGIKFLARSLYDGRRFGELPALGDALAAEGCREPAILEHCRGTGPHVRGCWVLDLLTGRT